MVLLRGHLITMSTVDTAADSVAITDGRVTAVGDAGSIRARVASSTRVIDLDGRTVTPGLIDSHAHLATLAARDLFKADLSAPGTTSIAQLVARLRTVVDATPQGQWVQGHGWAESALTELRSPTRQDLDLASRQHPILVTHLTGHSAVANSVALALAGIGRESVDPVGATVGRDSTTGEPTGLLTELPAIQMVQRHIPELGAADWDRVVAYGSQRWLEEGVTAIKDNYSREEYGSVVAAFQRMSQLGTLRLRPYLMCRVESPEDVRFVADHSPRSWTPADGFPKLGGVKLFMDGSLVGRTAWMNEPYKDSTACGYPALELSTLARTVSAAAECGLQVGIHAIGDRAVSAVLDAYEMARMRRRSGRRFSIMHALLVDRAAVRRMKAMRVIVETQSAFMPALAAGYANAIDSRRLRRIIPLRTLIHHGLTVTNGSDSPTAPIGPRYGLWAACTRPGSIDGVASSPYGRRECISAFTALQMYTSMGASAMELDDQIGSIEVGKLADLVVWDRNPLTIPAGELKEARPMMTIVNGAVAFEAKGTPCLRQEDRPEY